MKSVMKAVLVTILLTFNMIGAQAVESCADECASGEEETADCKACLKGEDVQKFCAENRDVDGCEELCCEEGCSSSCKMVNAGQIYNKKVCPYEVEDQTHQLFVPVILEADVENTCPFWDHGDQNLEVCKSCASLHSPCNDTYMACGGCACTPWHNDLGLDIKTHHTCDEIKEYYKTQNSKNLTCKDHNMDLPDPNNTGKVKLNVNDKSEEAKTLLTGFEKTECTTPIKCLKCEKVPFKLKFECNACNRGIPKLLKKCCDTCKKWVDGLQNDTTIPDHIKGYGWCSGCHVDEMDSFTGRPLPWRYAHLYANYTEEVADRGMEQHIEDHVCSLLAPECGAKTTTEAPSTTSSPQDESVIDFTPCLHATGSCPEERRLEVSPASRRARFLEAIGHADVADPIINTSCAAFNRSYYPKTGGRDGKKNTAEDVTVTHAPLNADSTAQEDPFNAESKATAAPPVLPESTEDADGVPHLPCFGAAVLSLFLSLS